MNEQELKEIEERLKIANENSQSFEEWVERGLVHDFAAWAEKDIPKLTAEVRRLNERDSDWHNLYMLQERYTAQYRLGSARMPQKILDGLKRFRRKLGIEFDILRDSSQTSTEP